MSVHLDTTLHTAHCCSRHGCRYDDEQCPVYFGSMRQDRACPDCLRRGSGPMVAVDPFRQEREAGERKTPVPPPMQHLTPEQMVDLLIDMLDTKDVRDRLVEVVADVLRERLLAVSEDRRRGSYVVIEPDVTDTVEIDGDA